MHVSESVRGRVNARMSVVKRANKVLISAVFADVNTSNPRSATPPDADPNRGPLTV